MASNSNMKKFQQKAFELLSILSDDKDYDETEKKKIESLGQEISDLFDSHTADLDEDDLEDPLDKVEFERVWSSLLWPLLSILSLLNLRHRLDLPNVRKDLNISLVNLINKKPRPSPPSGLEESSLWDEFVNCLRNTFTVLNGFFVEMEDPLADMEDRLQKFGEEDLKKSLDAFREFILDHSNKVLATLRLSEVESMVQGKKMDQEATNIASAVYCNVLCTLGCISGRLEGLRNGLLENGHRFVSQDTIKPLLETVFSTATQLINDCLLCPIPNVNAIFIDKTCFPFHCICLPPAVLFQQFDIQVVSEDTAKEIQKEILNIKKGARTADVLSAYPAAAQLGLKMRSEIKRIHRNATINAEQGWTKTQKKDDVLRKKLVSISPSWNEKSGWEAVHEQMLCFPTQKHGLEEENKKGQRGRRYVYYFYIVGKMFSYEGRQLFCRTLSLPFTLATVKNQDTKGRMTGSHTATCFWLYGLKNIDGLMLNWTEDAIEWRQFIDAFKVYFTTNGNVKRSLDDEDFDLIANKWECRECREDRNEDGERRITFTNILCPHLKYAVGKEQIKASPWRVMRGILQIFQDARTNAALLWDDNILMGFKTTEQVNSILTRHNDSMCLRISQVDGGTILISIRPGSSNVLHLEPLDCKKLQSKGILDYVFDIAEFQKIKLILPAANGQPLLVKDLEKKYRRRANHGQIRAIKTNTGDGEPVGTMAVLSFVPMRTVVVACDTTQRPPSPLSGITGTQTMADCSQMEDDDSEETGRRKSRRRKIIRDRTTKIKKARVHLPLSEEADE